MMIIRKTGQLVLIITLLFMFSCKTSKKSMRESTHQTEGIKQAEKDLLVGISRAICYSGFRDGQHPDRGEGAVIPTYEEILEDLLIISGKPDFHLIRLYDSGKNSEMVLEVIKNNNLDIKVMLGVWLQAEFSNHEGCGWLNEPIPDEELKANAKLNLEEIDRAIRLATEYNKIVVAVNVGNEALVSWNDHMVEVETVISYVQKVKGAIKQYVTVADNFKWWADSGADLAKEVDFVSVHIYPLWEGQGIDSAMVYSISNLKEVQDALPDAKIVITEAGWATIASEFGERASEENQQKYYNEFMSWTKDMNITTFWFEAFDESWKGDPDNMMGAEKHWGIYNTDRTPKLVMKQHHSK